jgi:curved DNA-binding protein CbpA
MDDSEFSESNCSRNLGNDKDDKLKESSLYDVLGVSKDATPAEIKAQFLKLSLIYHPDKETGDAQKFKSIMLAYKVLSNKKKRNTYDESLSNTWQELRNAEERDTSYKVSFEHTKVAEDGVTRVFDSESFHSAFHDNRNDADADVIRELGKGAEDLGASSNFGVVKAMSVEESNKILESRMQQRYADLDYMPGKDCATVDTLRSNFDGNLFNTIFNNLKGKKQEVADYDHRNNDEFLVAQDSSFSSFSTNLSSMFGQNATLNSNMGGLASLGGLHEQQKDEEILSSLDLARLMQEAEEQRLARGLDCRFTRDVRENAEEQQQDEYQRRLNEIREERERLFSMDKSQFVIRPSMIGEALGDPSLFDETIMTIDPARHYDEQEE